MPKPKMTKNLLFDAKKLVIALTENDKTGPISPQYIPIKFISNSTQENKVCYHTLSHTIKTAKKDRLAQRLKLEQLCSKDGPN